MLLQPNNLSNIYFVDVFVGEAEDVTVKIEYPEVTVDDNDSTAYILLRGIDGDNIEGMYPELTMQEQAQNFWSSKATACLIRNYKKYIPLVGECTRFKSLRDMFETISVEMHRQGFRFSSQKCENKWRVLERKYKNLVLREMLKKPGRIKHYGHWEHKKALDEIFNEKRKSVYLKQSEYPPSGTSTQYGIILPNPVPVLSQSTSTSNDRRMENPVAAICSALKAKNLEEKLKDAMADHFEKFAGEIKTHLNDLEKNKEKRHAEKMAMHKSELQIQERLLNVKEQELELQKAKIMALAQHVELNM